MDLLRNPTIYGIFYSERVAMNKDPDNVGGIYQLYGYVYVGTNYASWSADSDTLITSVDQIKETITYNGTIYNTTILELCSGVSEGIFNMNSTITLPSFISASKNDAYFNANNSQAVVFGENFYYTAVNWLPSGSFFNNAYCFGRLKWKQTAGMGGYGASDIDLYLNSKFSEDDIKFFDNPMFVSAYTKGSTTTYNVSKKKCNCTSFCLIKNNLCYLTKTTFDYKFNE